MVEIVDNVFFVSSLFIAKTVINLIISYNGIQIFIKSKMQNKSYAMIWKGMRCLHFTFAEISRFLLIYGCRREYCKCVDLRLWKWVFLCCAQHCLQVTFESKTFCIWHVVKSCHSLWSIVLCKYYTKCDCS